MCLTNPQGNERMGSVVVVIVAAVVAVLVIVVMPFRAMIFAF